MYKIKSNTRIISLVFLFLLAMTLIGCSSENKDAGKPTIKSIEVTKNEIAVNENTELTVHAEHSQNKDLSYKWVVKEDNGGSISSDGKRAVYTPNSNLGTFTIKVLVSDGKTKVSASKSIEVVEPDNFFSLSEIENNVLYTGTNNVLSLASKDFEITNVTCSVEHGAINYKKETNTIEYTAPSNAITETLTIEFSSPYGPKNETFTFDVYNKPTISQISDLPVGQTADIQVSNTSSVEKYKWSVEEGSLDQNDTANITYQAPNYPTPENLELTLTYPGGKTGQLNMNFDVYKSVNQTYLTQFALPNAVPENYSTSSLSGNFEQPKNDESGFRLHDILTENADPTNYLVDGYPWHYVAMGMDNVWEYTPNVLNGLDTVRVAMVDTGIFYKHQALTDEVDYNSGYDCLAEQEDSNLLIPYGDPRNAIDDKGHGTKTSGLVGAEDIGYHNIQGIAPNVEFVNVRITDSGQISEDLFRLCLAYISENTQYTLDEILYASSTIDGPPADHPIYNTDDVNVDIVNMSFGMGDGSTLSQGTLDAVEYLTNNNDTSNSRFWVSSAGNTGDLQPNYPANQDSVFSVGSVNPYYELSEFSNGGSSNEGADYVVPGSDILTTRYEYDDMDNLELYAKSEGTSLSAPLITGVLAILKGKDPSITRTEAMNKLDKYSMKVAGGNYNMPNMYRLLNEIDYSDVKVFIAAKDNNTLEVLSSQKSLDTNNEVSFDEKINKDGKVYAWVDVDNDGNVSTGDYFGSQDFNNQSLDLSVTTQNFELSN